VSRLWFLLPFFFGIFGGIVGYFAVRKKDRETAEELLIFGVAVWILMNIFFYCIGVF